MTEQKKKLKDLKERIKKEYESVELLTMNKETNDKGKEILVNKSEEDLKVNAPQVSIHKGNIKVLDDMMKETRMNRLGSTFFQWEATKNMNRQQARSFRKLQKKAQSKVTNK